MPSPQNPEYDPDWEKKSRNAAEGAARWQAEADQIAAAEGFGSQRHLAALAQQRAFSNRQKAAWRGQFATVAAYAAWRFASLPPARDGAALIPDFDAFGSLQDAAAAADRAAARRLEANVLDNALLPARQPPGLAAFADPAAIVTSWRLFGPAESPRDCLVSFHAEGGTFHFCLAHRWGALSPQSNDEFRQIATVLARQAIIFSIPAAAAIFEAGRHRLAEHRALIRAINARAATFRFYRHLWPHRALKEQFSRVDMVWDGAAFIDPDWTAELYPSLPPALRDIAADFPDVSALPAPQRSLT